jgi:hypothetical protein
VYFVARLGVDGEINISDRNDLNRRRTSGNKEQLGNNS